jgi:transketolase
VLLELSRQKLPVYTETAPDDVLRGGYVMRDCPGTPAVILIGTGSELQLAVAASDGWERYVGAEGVSVGSNEFGTSAPGTDVFAHFGLTVEEAVAAATTSMPRVTAAGRA